MSLFDTDPQGQAWLALAAGLLGGRGSFNSIAGNALLNAQNVFQDASVAKQRSELVQRQIGAFDDQQRRQTAKDEQAARVQRLLADAAALIKPIEANQYSGVTGPRPEALGAVGQQKPLDYRALFAQGVPAETLKDFAEAPTWGLPEVARTVETMDSHGRPVTRQMDKYGRNVGGDLGQYKPPMLVDTGGAINLFDPVTLESRMLPKSMSPSERDASARGWAGVNNARNRLNWDMTQGGNKPPSGYRFLTGGNLEAIPGGPADVKAGAAKEQAIKRAQAATIKADNVIAKVDEALSQTGRFTTGLPGAMFGMIPGTQAFDLGKTVDTIKANIGFNELQAMREMSPTGGALGQVAVRELDFLQATIANLDKNQSREQVEKNLRQVKQHFENWKNVMQQAANGDGGATGGWGGVSDDPLGLR